MLDLTALSPRVFCLGEALVDRLGPLGGDPATAAPESCDDRLGGAPANVACALARLGTPVGLVGRLGEDAIGAAFLELFSLPELSTSCLPIRCWSALIWKRSGLVCQSRLAGC